jgi:hypothetical protein
MIGGSFYKYWQRALSAETQHLRMSAPLKAKAMQHVIVIKHEHELRPAQRILSSHLLQIRDYEFRRHQSDESSKTGLMFDTVLAPKPIYDLII